MPTPDQLDNARARRTAILASIRQGQAANGHPPNVTDLAITHGVSRRQISLDLNRLKKDGRIELVPAPERCPTCQRVSNGATPRTLIKIADCP